MAQVQKVRADENIDVINEYWTRLHCYWNVLDKRELDKLKKELRPHFDETPNCKGDFYGHATKRLSFTDREIDTMPGDDHSSCHPGGDG